MASAPSGSAGSAGRRRSGVPIDAGAWLSDVDLTLRDSGVHWPALVRGRMARIAVEGHFGADRPWE